jgi:hypothetical protein
MPAPQAVPRDGSASGRERLAAEAEAAAEA